MLYLDSRSSSDDVVCRAWRSKSSLATSISRSLNCSALFVSRRLVISFCRVFCTELASVLACLYLVCSEISIHPPQSEASDPEGPHQALGKFR